MIRFVYIDIHVFLDGYLNLVLVLWISECLESVNKYLHFWFSSVR